MSRQINILRLYSFNIVDNGLINFYVPTKHLRAIFSRNKKYTLVILFQQGDVRGVRLCIYFVCMNFLVSSRLDVPLRIL